MTILINDSNFEQEVLKSNVITLVDFYADWCGPCKSFAKILEQIEVEMGDKIKICKVNVDDCPALTASYHISSLPTILIFNNGEIVNKYVGLVSKQKILELCGL
jgi:thioredoxin 1